MDVAKTIRTPLSTILSGALLWLVASAAETSTFGSNLALAQPTDEGGSVPSAKLDLDDDSSVEESAAPAGDDSDDEVLKHTPIERRGGFMLGIMIGAGIGSSAGFPLQAKKIGDPDFYTETGIGPAVGGSLFLGGALADWLNFGAGFDQNQIFADGTKGTSGVLFLHTDIFPLYWMGGTYRDLGLFLDTGTGSSQVTPDDDEEEILIDGGAVGHIAWGVMWEPLRFSKFAMGPYVGMTYDWSESIRRPMALVGWRSMLYVKP